MNVDFIIIGLTPQGLSLLRVLSRAGYNVVAFTKAKKVAGYYSKYGDKKLFTSVEELREDVVKIVNDNGCEVKCIITSGELLALIIREFPDVYDICNVEPRPLETVKKLSNKKSMYQYALDRGFKTAKFELLSEYSNNSLRFPLILKRNIEILSFFKVRKITDQSDFENFISKIEQSERHNYIVQEYISMDRPMDISFQGYFSQGECYCNLITHQVRRIRKGITSYLREIKDEKILALIRNKAKMFFQDTDYTGFAEIEFMHDEVSDDLFFIEVNTRTCGLQSSLSFKFSNLECLYDKKGSININLSNRSNEEGLNWINIGRDIKARLQNRDYKNLKQFIRAEYDVFDSEDLKPFLMQFFKR